MSIETYGEYQLLKKLATGGMAQIFLARQGQLKAYQILSDEARQYEKDSKEYRRALTMIVRHHYESRRTQVLASSMMLILVVNCVLDGLLVGASVFAATGSTGWSIAVGAVVAVAAFVLWMRHGYRSYRHVLRAHSPLRSAR